MGNIIKINMFSEMRKEKNSKVKLVTLEKNLLDYNKWLQKNHREDKIENYEKFLRVQ